MTRYSAFACTLLSICYSVSSPLLAEARKNNAPSTAPQAMAMQQARMQQEQALRSQQAQAQRAQQQQLRTEAQSRQSQERTLQAQEEQARHAQQQAIRAQQAQARQSQQAMRAEQGQARQAQKLEQEQSRQAEKAEQGQARQSQKLEQVQAQKLEQAQSRPSQQEALQAERQEAQQQRQAQQQQARASRQEATTNQTRTFRDRAGNSLSSVPPPGFSNRTSAQLRNDEGGNFATASRALEPRPLSEARVPLQKAVSMPVLDASASAQQRQHFLKVQNNLQNHLYAVPLRQAPPNIVALENAQRNYYLNNYQAMINNQALMINNQNTLCNVVAANQWPFWYRPQPGFQFCNGFTIGSSIECGLDWLRWGWHPYYGPQPDGFVCASNYLPTPWIYFPAYGLWRQPGVLGWAPGGPPYGYVGPITVEALEPRTVNVRDPYTGWTSARTINVVYMYNAFYYPNYDRWGYRNRHNYFIWVNL